MADAMQQCDDGELLLYAKAALARAGRETPTIVVRWFAEFITRTLHLPARDYYAKAVCLVADTLDTLRSEDLDARRPKMTAILRNAAAALASSPSLPAPEICICAAVRCDDGTIIRGHRHDNCILTAKAIGKGYTRQDMQGFVTSRNRYVSRMEGGALQNAAGIPSAHYGGPINGMLFSEDLY